MEDQKIYGLNIDGVSTPETYPSLEKAIEAAKLYFAANHEIRMAGFFTLNRKELDLEIRNKHYVEPPKIV